MDNKPLNFVDTSDNFLKRAVERLDESGSESAIRLSGYIVLELLHLGNRDD
jgi:hypothetical protein